MVEFGTWDIFSCFRSKTLCSNKKLTFQDSKVFWSSASLSHFYEIITVQNLKLRVLVNTNIRIRQIGRKHLDSDQDDFEWRGLIDIKVFSKLVFESHKECLGLRNMSLLPWGKWENMLSIEYALEDMSHQL